MKNPTAPYVIAKDFSSSLSSLFLSLGFSPHVPPSIFRSAYTQAGNEKEKRVKN
jgi:hypothetical protein